MWILETGVSGVNSGCVWRRLSEDERPPPPPPDEDEDEREEWSPWVGEGPRAPPESGRKFPESAREFPFKVCKPGHRVVFVYVG